MSRPRRSETVLTAEHLRRVLLYDPHTGLWKWREGGKGRPKEPDWWPGTLIAKGYLSIAIGRLGYYAHRLAFLYMTGAWPKHQADHVDGDRSNNRWANLREATGRQNKYNTGVRRTNTTGFRGVFRHNQTGSFVARIKVGDKRVSLGSYASAEEASAVYEAAAREHFGEFYRRLQ
jgi:hypothetical protein